MKGQITIETREQFDAWLATQFAKEQTDVYVPPAVEEEE
jgi:heme/copper-type cytochrome/quinol oxidase subunit 2